MKKLIAGFTVFLTWGSFATAAPILNESMAASGVITVYGDSVDPKLFYYAPNHMGVCRDEAGQPIFAYKNYVNNSGYKRGLVMTTMCLKYGKEIESVIAEIKSRVPDARFAGVAFTSSQMILKDESIAGLLASNSCNHPGGVIGQEQACSFVFNSNGRKVFTELMKVGLGLVLNFEYTIHGVRRNAAGGFDDASGTFYVAARIMKEDATRIPELQ
ncbi:MAG: hypothetical protein KF767_16350 [Bdellovibrionaceae bacterium]|nr:hypothetical protein [Pseudobdellovibrionaceae bacterium]